MLKFCCLNYKSVLLVFIFGASLVLGLFAHWYFHSQNANSSETTHKLTNRNNSSDGNQEEILKPVGQTRENFFFDDGGSSSTNSTTDYILPFKLPHVIKEIGINDSGIFRTKSALIWDPHPEYKFTAFGRNFHLLLKSRPGDPFDFTHHENDTVHRSKKKNTVLFCFYHGVVQGDSRSAVAVSLCEGMTGHMKTKDGSFFIEPIGQWKGPNVPLLHRIYRLSGPSSVGTSMNNYEDNNLVIGKDYNDPTNNTTQSIRVKRSMSKERYVELMVVTDSTMTAYHGENLKHYVLTLLSIVALVYKDASIGNPVNIALVNFHVLKDRDFAWREQRNNTGGISASEMLRNFCKWQKEQNNLDDHSIHHHDTALLLTRETICRNPWLQKCDTLGLAELGTMCDNYASCAIVQDNGLSAAFTIAHELGHVMNMPHDDDYKCQSLSNPSNNGGQQHYVMSRMLDHNTYPWAWSKCSRHFLTEFLDAGHGYCLEDKPMSNILEDDEIAESEIINSSVRLQPGEIFSEHKQCELVFGVQSKLCSYMPVCRRLWCTTGQGGMTEEQEGCRTQHMPWADGTSCGKNKWCQRGVCVLKDLEKLKIINGQWGQWGPYGVCSRSCGGGVKKSLRECDSPSPSNGGKYCIGPRVRYESCNTHECVMAGRKYNDFRDEQCSLFNNDNFNIQGLPKDVQWAPKYTGISPKDRCKLFCRVLGSSAYYLLREKVIDGTPCGPDTFDICVNGACLPAGCDRRLHSKKLLDRCGVCGGDESTCRTQNGLYNETKYGYSTVVRIPAGASSLDVRQTSFDDTARDDNYLAIFDPNKNEYLLNGDFVVSMFRKTVHYSGTILEYSGSDSAVERINSSRPIRSDLVIQVLSVGKLHPPDIRFQYVISHAVNNTYSWRNSEASPCTRLCQGTTTTDSICLRHDEEVDPSHCSSPRPSPEIKKCNEECTLKWRILDRSPCSKTCGLGRRQLIVGCVMEYSPGNYTTVADYNCGSGRVDEEVCLLAHCSVARWKTSQWSECNSRCGDGVQHRQINCIDKEENFIDDRYCNGSRPATTRKCSSGTCGKWKIDQWTPCSTTCGKGKSLAAYGCYLGETSLPPDYCHTDVKPIVERECEDRPCFYYQISEWSPCSATCGEGESRREVKCMNMNQSVNLSFCADYFGVRADDDHRSCTIRDCEEDNEIVANAGRSEVISQVPESLPLVQDYLHNSISAEWNFGNWSDCKKEGNEYVRMRIVTCPLLINCNEMLKPMDREPCGTWWTGNWSHCDCNLKGTIEQRDVYCILNARIKVTDDLCRPETRPESTRACSCVFWRTGPWGKCSRHCGGGQRLRQVVCQHRNGSESSACDVSSRPEQSSKCNMEGCPSWSVGQWGQCTSMTCDENGEQERFVYCQENGVTLPEYSCNTLKPNTVQKCRKICTNKKYRWSVGNWSKCSKKCGSKGVKKRLIECISVINRSRKEVVDDKYCNLRKPKFERGCARFHCPYKWVTSHWSKCSRDCGYGIEQRSVTCHKVNKWGWVDPDPVTTGCEAFQKPKEYVYCYLSECSSNFTWKTGEWSPCPTNCKKKKPEEKRLQRRKVFCTRKDSGSRVAASNCPKDHKPSRKRKCPTRKYCGFESCMDVQKSGFTADGEYDILTGGKNSSVFCHRMFSEDPKEFISLSEENISEIYPKRLIRPETCPRGGIRMETCECVEDRNRRSGVTTWGKIRINITNLRVDLEDYTFTRQLEGDDKIPYATSGDCYSSANCPQGKFLINLKKTGFVVSNLTKWVSLGHKTTARINRLSDKEIVGKCGGYCGTCSPPRLHGLKLDLE